MMFVSKADCTWCIIVFYLTSTTISMHTSSWCGVKSSAFTISNGARQGGVLSPHLFLVYVDQISENLKAVRSGCYAGKICINHISFADDVTLFNPSLTCLQELVDVCYDYALSHDIMFNCNKSRGMLFTPNHFNLFCKSPVLTLVNSGYILLIL